MCTKEKTMTRKMILIMFCLSAGLMIASASHVNAAPEKIAFESDRDGNPEIYVMNPDGSGQTRLTNNTAIDSSPSVNADGDHQSAVGFGL
jgi:hypothetical protein